MIRLGIALSSEEYGPQELVEQAVRAEDAGFSFAMVSDHFHPWTSQQGQSPFVWTTLGAISARTERIMLGTGVTCPTIRMHPAVVAHAAATVSVLAGGRFFLGVGTGERLNEHVTGARWPGTDERQEMLEEAVEVIRRLWTGDEVTHRGKHFAVEQAQLFTHPQSPPPIVIAAGGEASAQLAGRIGDGLVSTSADRALVEAFEGESGGARPRFGQVLVAWASNEAEGRDTLAKQWPNAVLGGSLGQELARPADYEAATKLVTPSDLEFAPAGPDPQPYLEAIREFERAGYDCVYLHQVGDVAGFLDFARRELFPALELEASPALEFPSNRWQAAA